MDIKTIIVIAIIVYLTYIFRRHTRKKSSIEKKSSDSCDCSKCNLKCKSRK
jgi:hypothetical protein